MPYPGASVLGWRLCVGLGFSFRDDSMSDLTVVLTSCRRPDLLIETLDSFFSTNDYPLREFIVIEDSDDETVQTIPSRYPEQPIRVILNGVNMGQHRSIDKAYSEVQTPYILHLEDDWAFPVSQVVWRGVEILKRDPQVSLVQLRTEDDMPRDIRRTPHVPGEIAYWRIPPAAHRVWHSFTFNPTVKRLSDYRKLPQGYAGFRTEAEISLYYKEEGAVMAWLAGTGVSHSGFGRSNYGYNNGHGFRGILQRLSRFFSMATIRKWRRSVERRVAHFKRKLGSNRL